MDFVHMRNETPCKLNMTPTKCMATAGSGPIRVTDDDREVTCLECIRMLLEHCKIMKYFYADAIKHLKENQKKSKQILKEQK